MKRLRFVALVSTVSLSVAALVLASSALSGTWVKNTKLSDDPEEKVREAVGGMIQRAERRARRPVDDPELRRRLGESVDTLIVSAETLVIEHDSDEFHVDDGRGRIRIFYLDGEKHIRQTPEGDKLETLCTVGENYVLVEQKMEGGVKIIENYKLSPDAGRMELTVRLEGNPFKEPLVVRSVYERDL